MLLTIANLPNAVKYSDIKAFVHSKCGLKDMILDNLTAHDNYSKKVTVGLSGEEDAAIFMRKMNGVYMDGRQLQVQMKSKMPDSNVNNTQVSRPPPAPRPPPEIPSLFPPGSTWYPGNYVPPVPAMTNQTPPTMVPAPMNYGMYANQSAYYQINQPAYPTQSTSSAEKVGYPQSYSYGNRSNQSDNNQNAWSNYNWNQQQPMGFSNTQQSTNQDTNWNNNQDSRQQESKWDNNQDSRRQESKWDNNQDSRRQESKWDNNQDSRRQESKWDNNRDSRRQESKWDNNRDSRRQESKWDNSRKTEWSNDNESGWDSNQQSSWNDNRGDMKRPQNSDSKWDSRGGNNRNTHRDSYQSNQNFGSSRQHDSSYMRNDQNSQSAYSNMYGDHVTASSDRGYNDNDMFDQYGNKQGRNRSPYNRDQGPAAKRSRFSNDETERQDRHYSNKRAPESGNYRSVNKTFVASDNQRERVSKANETGIMWRQQLASKFANKTITDTCCMFEGVNSSALFDELKRIFRARIDNLFKNNYSLNIKVMDQKYSEKYNESSHCAVLKEATKKLGGYVITVSRSQTVGPQGGKGPKSKRSKGNKGPGGNANFAPYQGQQKRLGARGAGNPTFNQQKGPSRKPNAQGGNNQQSIPLALIPGRIPQYPKGDKMQFKKQKKEAENIFNDHNYLVNLMKNLKAATKLALGEEIAILAKVMEDACNDPDPEEAKFGAKVKQLIPKKMSTILKVNLTKRMTPIYPLQISAFSTPKIKRHTLENFLTNYKVSTLKKSKSKPMYILDCNSVDDFDKLCNLGPVLIGPHTVNFKPFHLGGSQEKIKYKSEVVRQRQEIRDAQLRHSDHSLGFSKFDFWDPLEDGGSGATQKAKLDAEFEQEEICEEMKEIYDQINNPDDLGNENTAECGNLKCKQEQDTTNTDFSTDVDVDNFGVKPKNEGGEEPSKQFDDNSSELPKGGGRGGENTDNEVDIADVNEDDLEDW